MAHSYRTLHQWDLWLRQTFLGDSLLKVEKKLLTQLLTHHFGKHALLIGVPHQYLLLNSAVISMHSLVSPLALHENNINYIESSFRELPILTGSVDLVLLPHTLEYTDNPRQLLAEACRIIKPEGLIGICGFNPYSTWGLRKFMLKNQHIPWASNFIHARHIKSWLQLADFKMEKQLYTLYRPPILNQHFYEKLYFIEKMGKKLCSMLGGVYIILARAKVLPLTPIKMKWKQQLSGLRIPTIISSHNICQSAFSGGHEISERSKRSEIL